MKRFISVLVVIVLVLGGCAGVGAEAVLQMEDLAEVEDRQLCDAFSEYPEDERLRTEVEERDLITDRDWQVIDNPDADIGTGMTPLGVICSRGEPSSINRFEDGEEWVYGWPGSRAYVYFSEGEVISWQ